MQTFTNGFTTFGVKNGQQTAMPRSLFTGANTNILTDFKIKQTPVNQNGKQPKRFVFFVLLLLVFTLGALAYNQMNQHVEEPIHTQSTESQRLESLTEKLKSQELTETEWNELCQLLANVKGISINNCENCRDYLRALLGGRHDVFLRNYEKVTDKEISKGIRSLQKQIDFHQNKSLRAESS